MVVRVQLYGARIAPADFEGRPPGTEYGLYEKSLSAERAFTRLQNAGFGALLPCLSDAGRSGSSVPACLGAGRGEATPSLADNQAVIHAFHSLPLLQIAHHIEMHQ